MPRELINGADGEAEAGSLFFAIGTGVTTGEAGGGLDCACEEVSAASGTNTDLGVEGEMATAIFSRAGGTASGAAVAGASTPLGGAWPPRAT